MANGFKPMKHKDIKPLREQILKEQEYKCAVCKRNIKPEDACLDHDHDTGLIRGVLCTICNNYIEARIRKIWKRSGLSKEVDLEFILLSLHEYLSREQYPYIHPSEVPKNPKLMKSSYNELCREINKANKYLKQPIKCPKYPKSKRLTKRLKELFEQFGITPRFYSK